MARDGIGYRVARWRDTAGMTQQQLADRVGKTRAYISLIENGRKPVTKRSLLIDLAHALGASITDLTAQPYEPDPAEPGYAALFSAVPRIRVALTGPDEPVRPRPVSALVADADTALARRMAADHATLIRATGLVTAILGTR
jgi:transcriptional regulator with XRE-family HTH domain